MKPFVRQNNLHVRIGLIFILLLLYSVGAWAQKKPLTTAKLNKCLPLFDALNTGHLSLNPKKYTQQLKVAQEELRDLKYMGVTVWKPKEITDFQRKLVRHHDVEKYAHSVPKFEKSQKLGPDTVDIDQLFFSQLGCQNASEGGFTVINNAKAFKDGSLKVDDLPALRVWRDSENKIWTLDHRRLAAMKLSGNVKTAKVEFVSEEIVKQQRFKFDTQTNGEIIFVRVEKPVKSRWQLSLEMISLRRNRLPQKHSQQRKSIPSIQNLTKKFFSNFLRNSQNNSV